MTNTDKDYYRGETTTALEAILYDQGVQDYDLLSHIAGILSAREVDARRATLLAEVEGYSWS